MDETLVHTMTEEELTKTKPDAILKMKIPNTGSIFNVKLNFSLIYKARVCIRPNTVKVLKELKDKNCEIIIYTASEQYYCDAIIHYLDPTGKLVDHIFYRKNCIRDSNGEYIKDLRVFQNRSLKNTVLIDNSPFIYLTMLDNAIPIIPFTTCKKDRELDGLMSYLCELIKEKDVRVLNRKTFKLYIH